MAPTLQYRNLKDIRILYEHYERNANREEQIRAMVRNLYVFVNWLRSTSTDRHIRSVLVEFRDEARDKRRQGDIHWCTQLGDNSGTEDLLLTINGKPIVEELLQPLIGFPVCQEALVDPLGGVAYKWEREDETESSLLEAYDMDYVMELFDSYENWLRGNRDKQEKNMLLS